MIWWAFYIGTAFALVAGVECAFCGQFNYGFAAMKSDEVTLRIPRPPDAYIPKKNVNIQVAEVADKFTDLNRLRMSIEQALTPDYSVVASQPEATFKVSVVSYEPPTTRTYTQTETHRIKVGQKPSYKKDGTPKRDSSGSQVYEDVYESRQVPVEYWEARGSLSLKVEVVDANGVLLDGFSPSVSHSPKIKVSINNESQIGGKILPGPDSMLSSMIQDLSAKFATHYCKTFSSVKFKLACDKELRPANQMAMAGDWHAALKRWETTKMEKKQNEGDRIYNMAVAHEAMAYSAYNRSQNLEEAEPLFIKALQLYDEAMRLDPREKYIQQASARLQMAKTHIEGAKRQYAAQKFQAEKLLAELEEKRRGEEAGAKELTSIHPDTPEEASFRSIVRLRLKALQVRAAEADLAKLEATGQHAYKLEPAKAKRVVASEVKRRDKVQASMAIYKDNFAAFVTKKKLSTNERKALVEIARNLALSEEDTKAIESEFQFQEEGMRPSVKAARRKPSAPKPRSEKVAEAKPAPAASIQGSPAPKPVVPPKKEN